MPPLTPGDGAALRRRAEAGDPRAQLRLGESYAVGVGVAQDPAEAARWYRMAAERGFAAAQYALGLTYAKGKGLPEDSAEAVRWYRRAAEQGYAAARYALGWMHEKGQGVPQDSAAAVRWYRVAAEQGYAKRSSSLAGCASPARESQRIRRRQRGGAAWPPRGDWPRRSAPSE